jgi:hypothetical protein
MAPCSCGADPGPTATYAPFSVLRAALSADARLTNCSGVGRERSCGALRGEQAFPTSTQRSRTTPKSGEACVRRSLLGHWGAGAFAAWPAVAGAVSSHSRRGSPPSMANSPGRSMKPLDSLRAVASESAVIGREWAQMGTNETEATISSPGEGWRPNKNPAGAGPLSMELAGLEPATSWVRSRRSPS